MRFSKWFLAHEHINFGKLYQNENNYLYCFSKNLLFYFWPRLIIFYLFRHAIYFVIAHKSVNRWRFEQIHCYYNVLMFCRFCFCKHAVYILLYFIQSVKKILRAYLPIKNINESYYQFFLPFYNVTMRTSLQNPYDNMNQ